MDGNRNELRSLRGGLWGGAIAGTLELLAMFATNGLRGRTPDIVLHGIASALLGVHAYRGGFTTGALGFLLHYGIALTFAVVYWTASRMGKLLVRYPAVCGLLYGIPVYGVMNFLVIPRSRIGTAVSHSPAVLAAGILLEMVCVGLPIGLAVGRFSRE